uniref:RRN3 homolog, RNA polymerase I transcription factor n=1 Tax=Oncorhynchus kisutch TaxID=8019 RepID=A0A8C7J7K9_ONCKI
MAKVTCSDETVLSNMPIIEGRDFMNTPPLKTVRFGGNVVATLAKFKQGDTSDYELLKHQLADPDIKDAQIINWLQEFRNCVTQLSKDHEQLIYVALRLPWLGRSPAVVEEYLSFLSNLVSAQTVYLRACLKMVVSNFKPSDHKTILQHVAGSFSDPGLTLGIVDPQCKLVTNIFFHPSHFSTSCFLMPILIDNFPFVQKSSRTLECYVHNLLSGCCTVWLSFTLPRSFSILRLMWCDVSLLSLSLTQDEDVCSVKSSPAGTNVMVHPVAERLDTLMVVLLAFIKDMCHVNGCLDVERTKDLYKDLVCVFDKLILPTHASCHVQYALFYLCSFRLALAEAFLEHLWRLLQSQSHPAVLRQSAAGYMGSFLARANFLPVATVRACLDLLVPWLHLYIDSQDSGSRAYCDITLHGPFYNACQAVFYTLIFRHRSILEGNMKKGLAYLQSLNLERIVMCQLNPLKVCLPAVTNMFAAITRKYQLVFCYTIIERNNRHVLPVVRSSVGGDCVSTNTNPLDSFFPFDPYVLKRSSKLIEPLYQVWEEPCSDADEDDFLRGETPETKGVMGMTPGSYESHLHSPSSVGSPPISFLQRPYHH